MKRKLLCFLTILTICLSLPMTAFAEVGGTVTRTAAHPSRLVDGADLLTDSEEQTVRSDLDAISERLQFDVVVVTTATLGSKTAMEYADDYFDDHGYGYGTDRDGALLLVSMEDRDYWISTTGYGITAITDHGIAYLKNEILPELSDGEYADAFETFGEEVSSLVQRAKAGDVYDDDPNERHFNWVFWIPVAVIVGIVLSIITAVIVKNSMMKSVREKANAAAYEKKDGLRLTENRDQFLYNTLTKHYNPPKDNDGGGSSTHTSSSGSTHGGGGGKF